jgi:hypothetical protein
MVLEIETRRLKNTRILRINEAVATDKTLKPSKHSFHTISKQKGNPVRAICGAKLGRM